MWTEARRARHKPALKGSGGGVRERPALRPGPGPRFDPRPAGGQAPRDRGDAGGKVLGREQMALVDAGGRLAAAVVPASVPGRDAPEALDAGEAGRPRRAGASTARR